MTRAVGVIPARWGSTRLPGKSLRVICGKPLIQWVVERARAATSLDELMVATDDRRIADAVRSLGVRAVMTRSDHPSGTDRVAEALRDGDAEIVVNIQGDEPLLDPCLVDRLVDVLSRDRCWDMATAAAPIRNREELARPSVVKVVRDARGRALYFSRAAIPHIRDDDGTFRPGLHWRHLGIYAYRMSFLRALVSTPVCAVEQAEKLEQLRALHLGAAMAVLETQDEGIGVDTAQDVEYVERIMKGSRTA